MVPLSHTWFRTLTSVLSAANGCRKNIPTKPPEMHPLVILGLLVPTEMTDFPTLNIPQLVESLLFHVPEA